MTSDAGSHNKGSIGVGWGANCSSTETLGNTNAQDWRQLYSLSTCRRIEMRPWHKEAPPRGSGKVLMKMTSLGGRLHGVKRQAPRQVIRQPDPLATPMHKTGGNYTGRS